MIRETDDGWLEVCMPDGFVVACTDDEDLARDLDALTKCARSQANVSLPAPLAKRLDALAASAGVSRAAYCLSVLQAHVLGREVDVSPRATGMAAVSPETRRRVAKKAAAGRARKRR